MPYSVAVIGATGDIGRRVVDALLTSTEAPCWQVTAACRSWLTARLPYNQRLSIVNGKLDKPDDLRDKLKGHDAVICVAGPRDPRNPHGFFSKGLPNLVRACAEGGVRRLVILTEDYDADVRDPAHPQPWAARSMRRLLRSATHADMRKFEDWAAGTFGLRLGRPLPPDAPTKDEALASRVALTLVRAQSFKNVRTAECRAQVVADNVAPTPPGGSTFCASRAGVARFLAEQAWRAPQYANTVVLLDTQLPVGCF